MPFTPPEEQIESELARVINSRCFSRSARQRTLLGYLVNARRSGESSRLKESTIALDVFGRDAATYDSATDGIVRVSINRLRDLLDRYYEDEGARTPLRFEIQRGGYTPIIRRATPPGLPELPRIAVLPLANFTGHDDKETLCDGLTEDIIDAMTRVPDVRVIARTSSFRFKKQVMDIRAIASELAVDALLEGSVQMVGDRLRVTAQFILASDGTHLWSHAFTVDHHERRTLQDALIDIMVRSLRPGATVPEPSRPPAAVPAVSVQAQSLIDQARGLNVTQVPDNVVFAEALANRATELAPEHADAWFVLAMVRYSRHSLLQFPSSDDATASARYALDRALALDPDFPQAISLSAYLLITEELRWSDALQFARRAAVMAPNHAGINARLAFLQLCVGHFAESVQTYAHVLSLDPLAPPARYHHALALATAGRYDDAIARINEARQILGASVMHQETLSLVLEMSGDLAAATRHAEAAWALHPTATIIAMHVAYCQAANGDLAGARALCDRVDSSDASRHYVRMYAESGGPDADAFFHHAMAVAGSHEPRLMLLPSLPIFAPHHADPRWQALLDKLRFPQ